MFVVLDNDVSDVVLLVRDIVDAVGVAVVGVVVDAVVVKVFVGIDAVIDDVDVVAVVATVFVAEVVDNIFFFPHTLNLGQTGNSRMVMLFFV